MTFEHVFLLCAAIAVRGVSLFFGQESGASGYIAVMTLFGAGGCGHQTGRRWWLNHSGLASVTDVGSSGVRAIFSGGGFLCRSGAVVPLAIF